MCEFERSAEREREREREVYKSVYVFVCASEREASWAHHISTENVVRVVENNVVNDLRKIRRLNSIITTDGCDDDSVPRMNA